MQQRPPSPPRITELSSTEPGNTADDAPTAPNKRQRILGGDSSKSRRQQKDGSSRTRKRKKSKSIAKLRKEAKRRAAKKAAEQQRELTSQQPSSSSSSSSSSSTRRLSASTSLLAAREQRQRSPSRSSARGTRLLSLGSLSSLSTQPASPRTPERVQMSERVYHCLTGLIQRFECYLALLLQQEYDETAEADREWMLEDGFFKHIKIDSFPSINRAYQQTLVAKFNRGDIRITHYRSGENLRHAQFIVVLAYINYGFKYLKSHDSPRADALLQTLSTSGPVFNTLSNIEVPLTDASLPHGYIRLPTGFGKSVTSLFIAMGMMTEKKERALYLVPRINLIQQTVEEVRRHFPDTTVAVIGGQSRPRPQAINKADIIICTYHSIIKDRVFSIINTDTICLAIFDEVHMSLSENRAAIIDRLKGLNVIVMGYTATDTLNKQAGLNEVREVLAPIYERELPEAIDDKILSPLIRREINIDYSSLKEAQKQQMQALLTVRESEARIESSAMLGKVHRATNIPAIYDIIANIYANGTHPVTGNTHIGESAMVFCARIEQAEAVAKRLNDVLAVLNDSPVIQALKRRFPNFKFATAIHSKTYRVEEAIAATKRGEVLIGVSVKKLEIGYNNPKVSLCFNLVPTGSEANYLQRVGRVVRLVKNKIAITYDFLWPVIWAQSLPRIFNGRWQLGFDNQAAAAISSEINSSELTRNYPIRCDINFSIHTGTIARVRNVDGNIIEINEEQAKNLLSDEQQRVLELANWAKKTIRHLIETVTQETRQVLVDDDDEDNDKESSSGSRQNRVRKDIIQALGNIANNLERIANLRIGAVVQTVGIQRTGAGGSHSVMTHQSDLILKDVAKASNLIADGLVLLQQVNNGELPNDFDARFKKWQRDSRPRNVKLVARRSRNRSVASTSASSSSSSSTAAVAPLTTPMTDDEASLDTPSSRTSSSSSEETPDRITMPSLSLNLEKCYQDMFKTLSFIASNCGVNLEDLGRPLGFEDIVLEPEVVEDDADLTSVEEKSLDSGFEKWCQIITSYYCDSFGVRDMLLTTIKAFKAEFPVSYQKNRWIYLEKNSPEEKPVYYTYRAQEILWLYHFLTENHADRFSDKASLDNTLEDLGNFIGDRVSPLLYSLRSYRVEEVVVLSFMIIAKIANNQLLLDNFLKKFEAETPMRKIMMRSIYAFDMMLFADADLKKTKLFDHLKINLLPDQYLSRFSHLFVKQGNEERYDQIETFVPKSELIGWNDAFIEDVVNIFRRLSHQQLIDDIAVLVAKAGLNVKSELFKAILKHFFKRINNQAVFESLNEHACEKLMIIMNLIVYKHIYASEFCNDIIICVSGLLNIGVTIDKIWLKKTFYNANHQHEAMYGYVDPGRMETTEYLTFSTLPFAVMVIKGLVKGPKGEKIFRKLIEKIALLYKRHRRSFIAKKNSYILKKIWDGLNHHTSLRFSRLRAEIFCEAFFKVAGNGFYKDMFDVDSKWEPLLSTKLSAEQFSRLSVHDKARRTIFYQTAKRYGIDIPADIILEKEPEKPNSAVASDASAASSSSAVDLPHGSFFALPNLKEDSFGLLSLDSETLQEGLTTYQLPIDGGNRIVKEIIMPADGDCALHCFGLSREDASNKLLQNSENVLVRHLVAPEIADLILCDDMPAAMKHAIGDKTTSLLAAYHKAKTLLDESVKEKNDKYQFEWKYGHRYDFKGLLSSPVVKSWDKASLKRLKSHVKESKKALMLYCHSEPVFKLFVMYYVRQPGCWLGYKDRKITTTLDALAYLQGRSLRVWRMSAHHSLPQSFHEVGFNSYPYINLFHVNLENPQAATGQNHFNRFEIQPSPEPSKSVRPVYALK